jgi:glutamate carboxypeptidase
MKGGLVVAVMALRALNACRLLNFKAITFLFIPDEELGSFSSRRIIESEANKADWAFVMEPARANGGVVTSRGAVGAIYFRAKGRTAYCGGNYAEGISAVRELARMVEPIESLSSLEEECIINVGVFRGGEARQVIPGEAEIHIDLRAPDNDKAKTLLSQLKEIARNPADPKVEICTTGGLTRPAYRRTDGILDLYQRASAIAKDMGISLPEVHSRAGSDANLIAAQGTPALDGLGPIAWDVCSRRERISLASLGERAILLAHLLAGLND